MTTPTIALCAISAAISAAGAYQWQAYRYDARMAALVAEYAQAQHTAIEVAHAETLRYQQKADEAAQAAAKRVRAASADRDILRRAVDGLRDTVANASGAGTNTGAASTDNAAAARVVSAECAEALATMAGHADGWRSEAMMLREAWPVHE